jgi:hypothetical protein
VDRHRPLAGEVIVRGREGRLEVELVATLGQRPASRAQGKKQQKHKGDQRVGETPRSGGWGSGTTNSRGSLQRSEAKVTSFQTRVRSAKIVAARNEEVQSAGGIPQASENANPASVQLSVSARGPEIPGQPQDTDPSSTFFGGNRDANEYPGGLVFGQRALPVCGAEGLYG